jgi:hypothetical protein
MAQVNWNKNLLTQSHGLLSWLLDIRANLVYLTGHVTAKDGRPLLDEHAVIEHMPIERIDGNGGVLDYNLAKACSRQRRIAHLQRSAGFDKVCSFVLGSVHFHVGIKSKVWMGWPFRIVGEGCRWEWVDDGHKQRALWLFYVEMPSFTRRSSGSDKHPILPEIISKHLPRYGKNMVDGVLLQTSMWLRRFDEQEAD